MLMLKPGLRHSPEKTLFDLECGEVGHSGLERAGRLLAHTAVADIVLASIIAD